MSASTVRCLRWVLVGAFVASGVLCSPASSLESDRRPSEYEVKAAYLYHFVRYVEWPDDLDDPGAPFVVAILGDDPFGSALDDAFSGKTLADRPATVVRIHQPEDAATARVVFISASESAALPRIMQVLSGRSVLTVGDVSEMARRGAIIAFRVDGNKVRFDINVDRAEHARLKLSSQLLKVATIVGDKR